MNRAKSSRRRGNFSTGSPGLSRQSRRITAAARPKLSLEYIGNNPYSTKVIVEWIDSNAQKIEGKVYRSHINVYGLVIEDWVPLHEIEWTGNQIVIHEPSEQQITFELFSNELFTLNQSLLDEEIRMVRGQTYIHLKVPKHIEIVDPLGLQIY